MSIVNKCECVNCQLEIEHSDKKHHHQINLFLSRLNEQQKRWYVAMEAMKIGNGGQKLMSEITGMDEKTIRRGIEELENELSTRPEEKVRLDGGGRPSVEKKLLK